MSAARTGILLETGTNEVEILELFIDEGDYQGHYGVNVAKVLEIIKPPEKVVRVPNMTSPFVLGMFNHRDKLIPLVDLAAWLGKTRVETKKPAILITEFNKVTTAFAVSGVVRIHRLTWKDIKPLEGSMAGLSDTITGIVEPADRIVFILDLEKAIGDLNPEFAINLLSTNESNESASSEGPFKVLHVDDSSVVRSAVKHLLEAQNKFSVTSVNDGDQAWSHLEALKKRCQEQGCTPADLVDVVLADIEMPGMDGYHLCKKIKEDADLKVLPVVLFSSLISDRLLHKGEAVGADAQYTKPDLSLVAGMTGLIEKRKAGAAQKGLSA